jgi:adenylate kinase family enzyme
MTPDAPELQNVLVMGKSGAGKQPRIDVLVKEFSLTQLSTGDMFRHYLGLLRESGYPGGADDFWDTEASALLPDERIRESLAPYAGSTEELEGLVLGAKARSYVEAGLFVPDELVNDIFGDAFRRMGSKGAVLDGYPRTLAQAQHLAGLVEEAGTRLDLIVLVENDDETIVVRTIGRRICPSCNKVFHLEHKPPREGRFCTVCGTEVVQRSDDTEERIRNRLREFHEKVVPTIEYLRCLGIPIAVVPGNLPVFTEEIVRRSVLEAIEVADIDSG